MPWHAPVALNDEISDLWQACKIAMPRYHTGFFSGDLEGAPAFFRGAGFSLEKTDGRDRGSPAKNRRFAEALRRDRGFPASSHYSAGRVWHDGEIIIKALSDDAAYRAFNLFLSAIAVYDNNIMWLPEPFQIDFFGC